MTQQIYAAFYTIFDMMSAKIAYQPCGGKVELNDIYNIFSRDISHIISPIQSIFAFYVILIFP